MLRLPLVFNLRPWSGVEIIADGVAGGQGLVAVQVGANHARNGVVRAAHDGEDVHVPGSFGEGAQSAGGETHRAEIGRTFPIVGSPVVFRLEPVCLVNPSCVFLLELRAEELHVPKLSDHQWDGVCGVTHLAVEFIRHTAIQFLHSLINGKPHGAAGQVHLHTILAV